MMPETMPNFSPHLDDRREAVRGAGGVRDDVVLRRIVLLLVYAEDHVMSSLVAGAEMMTFFTGPRR